MGIKIVSRNRKANFEYFLLEKYEAGISLVGSEIKSIREGQLSLGEAYVRIDNGKDAWFEEDDLLEKMGKPRLHTDDAGYFKYPYLWDLLIERISLEHKKLKRDISELDNQTILIEFSRGSQHGGYRSAFQHLSDSVLERLAIIYIDVPFEESLRKNRRRFNPDRPDSILEHGLSDEKLNSLYKDIDWFDLLETPTHIEIKGHAVPYVIFDNQDDVTTVGGEPLGDRLQIALNRLWQLSSH